jgi:hypothetical protein
MAFHADQRRGSYRFLAEHAARPRMVWLARHSVWLGALLALYAVIATIIAIVAAHGFASRSQSALDDQLRHGQAIYANVAFMIVENVQVSRFIMDGFGLAVLGVFTAYAIGQLCSMLWRSEILAAFLAVVLSVVLSAWIAVLFVWQLSGWLFLLPLAVGFFAATWLRAPSWIAGRNEIRNWWGPALALVTSFAIVAFLLPIVRLGQLPPTADTNFSEPPPSLKQRQAIRQLRQTADEYMKVAERLAAGHENLMANWATADRPWTPGGFLEDSIPPEQIDEFRETERQQLSMMWAAVEEAVAAAIELSKRPACRFDFHLNLVALRPTKEKRELSLGSYAPYTKLKLLMDNVLYAPQLVKTLAADGGVAPAASVKFSFLERTMAALRMSAHFRNGQPSVIFIDQLRQEREILRMIGDWSQQEGRSEQELRDALTQLEEHFSTAGHSIDAADPLLADAALVRDVILGKSPSLAQALAPKSLPVQLAVLANELRWERTRALRALDRMTNFNRDFVRNLTWNVPQESWVIREPRAATSYLARYELDARTSMPDLLQAEMDTETFRRATQLQIAIALYRLEHGSYPSQLSELVPALVEKQTLLDPFTSQPFQYQPRGLDLPLETWGWHGVGRIEPDVPVFWSVGPTNLRLTQGANVVRDPQDEAAEGRFEQRYLLVSDDWANWRPSDTPLVFPLAKPETKEQSEPR